MGRQFKPGQLQTGSLYNISSSYALTASYLSNYIAPFPFTGSAQITGSLGVTGSINGLFISTGYGNVATNVSIGSNALRSNTIGTNNTAIGSNALFSSTVANHNTAIGCNALYTNLVGNYNTAIGLRALCSNFVGANNTAIGNDALRNNTNGGGNTAIGKYTLSSNTTGNYNTAIDRNALRYNTTGTGNIAFGYNALRYNTTGCHNIAQGLGAMRCNVSGNYNIALGEQALRNITSGSCNIVLGTSAARLNSVSGGITSLSSSIVIGVNAKPSASGDINEIIIGDSAIGLGSNTTVIGNVNTTTARIWGQLTANSFTGSLAGTASYAVQALSASYIQNAQTASYVTLAQSASFVQNAVSSSFATTTTSASFATNSNNSISSSYALSASYLNTLNQDLIFNGNLALNGTASIAYLNVSYESASVIYSSGSNQFGDAANDVQTLYGSVVIPTGSLTVTGSVIATSFTGSLFGTASFASTASYVNTLRQDVILSGSLYITGSNRIGVGTTNPSYTIDLPSGSIRSFTVAVGNDAAGSAVLSTSGNYMFVAGNNNHDVILPGLFAARSGTGYGVGIQATQYPAVATSAILTLTSTTKGFLPTRTNLTSNIATPAQGLMTYVTASATEGLYYYNSGSYQGWTRLLNETGSQSISGSLTVTGSILNLGTSRFSANGGSSTLSSNALTSAAAIFYQNGLSGIVALGGYSNAGGEIQSYQNGGVTVGGTLYLQRQGGSIGVGTTSPLATFDVVGSGRFSNGLTITGSQNITGSLTVTSGITGSLFGTSSFAVTASYIDGGTF
jgi:hypothetical protein